ncbi:MAG: hypothetical protein AB1486_23480 [Planctomycetota bacterium]
MSLLEKRGARAALDRKSPRPGPVLGISLTAMVFMLGCASSRDLYESAMRVVRQPDLPDEEDVAEALAELDEAVARARSELRDEDLRTPSYHDASAYIVPLAHLAQAELHGRFNQVTRQEQACWDAVRTAEETLGRHVTAPGQVVLFADYSVFFRREKVRRQAFTLLKESYRKAGEKDLEELMRAQIGLSDIYLRSPFAHGEEEQIRTFENADWVRRYDIEKAGVGNGIAMTLLIIATIGMAASMQAQQAELQQAQYQTDDPAVRADIQARMQQLEMQQQQALQQFSQTAEVLAKAHEAEVRAIEARYQNTTVGALMANFEMLNLSEEVKQLEAYRQLSARKTYFDGYVIRHGFDAQAARALVDVRTELDRLTERLQARRRLGEL